jgi:hypothetical protein
METRKLLRLQIGQSMSGIEIRTLIHLHRFIVRSNGISDSWIISQFVSDQDNVRNVLSLLPLDITSFHEYYHREQCIAWTWGLTCNGSARDEESIERILTDLDR